MRRKVFEALENFVLGERTMKKIFLLALLGLALLTGPLYGAYGLKCYTLTVLNEKGEPVTGLTSVDIQTTDAGTSATIYSDDQATAKTNPIVSGLSTGTITFWYAETSCDIVLTDGTNTVTIQDFTPVMHTVEFYSGAYTYAAIAITGTATVGGVATFASDVNFNGTYDVIWDDSRSQLSFADNATLGLGGAYEAAGDFTLKFDATDLLMEAATADTIWKRGATTNFDEVIYGDTATDYIYYDTSAELCYFEGFDLRFNDGDFLKFGDDSDWTFDSSTTKILDIVPLTTDETSAIYIGADEAGADVKMFAATSGDYAEFDASAGAFNFEDVSIALGDGTKILFGDTLGTGDFQLSDESDVLTFDVVVGGTGEMAIGNDADDVPLKWYGETTGAFVYFTGDIVQVDKMKISFSEGDGLLFGDDLGTGDISITGTSNVLTFGQVVAGTGSVAFGVNDAGVDVLLYGDAASAAAQWDASLNKFNLMGDAAITLRDDVEILFGTGAADLAGDLKMSSNSSNILNLGQVVADTGTMTVGADDHDIPITWYAETSGDYVLFSADDVIFEDVSLCIAEGTQIQFGDTPGTGDVTLSCASNLLTIGQVVAGTGAVAFGVNDAGVDSTFYADTSGDYSMWDASDEAFEFVGADIALDSDSQILDARNAGTKVVWGTPVSIVFSPDAAATLTYTVPTGYDLVVHAAWGYKAAGNGAHDDDDIDLQHNDGTAANIFDCEELNGVNDGVYFEFSGLVDTENEIEAGETLDCVSSENAGNGCDCHIIVIGTLKTAD